LSQLCALYHSRMASVSTAMIEFYLSKGNRSVRMKICRSPTQTPTWTIRASICGRLTASIMAHYNYLSSCRIQATAHCTMQTMLNGNSHLQGTMSCPYFIVRSANHPKALINEFIITICPTLPVQHSYTINTVFRYVFCPRNLPLAIPHIGLSYSSSLIFDFIELRIIFSPQEIKFKFPAEI